MSLPAIMHLLYTPSTPHQHHHHLHMQTHLIAHDNTCVIHVDKSYPMTNLLAAGSVAINSVLFACCYASGILLLHLLRKLPHPVSSIIPSSIIIHADQTVRLPQQLANNLKLCPSPLSTLDQSQSSMRQWSVSSFHILKSIFSNRNGLN